MADFWIKECSKGKDLADDRNDLKEEINIFVDEDNIHYMDDVNNVRHYAKNIENDPGLMEKIGIDV